MRTMKKLVVLMGIAAVSTSAFAIGVGDKGWVFIGSATTNMQCQSHDFDTGNTLHNSYCDIVVNYGNCQWRPNPATGANECWCPAEVTGTMGDCSGMDFGDFVG